MLRFFALKQLLNYCPSSAAGASMGGTAASSTGAISGNASSAYAEMALNANSADKTKRTFFILSPILSNCF
jgi:hypothetical protein